ncbi:MAG: Flp family type IVb pilin [Acetobacteraceae bacterium]|nr:Flp family type IVb pilin [Acetobacteraceae bacterium]
MQPGRGRWDGRQGGVRAGGGEAGTGRWAWFRRLRRAAADGLRQIAAWAASPEGATTTEYALLLALVVVVLIGTLSALGSVLNEKLQEIIDEISHAG